MIILIESLQPVSTPSTEDFYRDYYHQHRCCPSCLSEEVETTTAGGLMINGGVDRNRASCGCGWRGIVHDMVPSTISSTISNIQ